MTEVVQRGSKWLVVDAEGSKVTGGGPFVSSQAAARVQARLEEADSAGDFPLTNQIRCSSCGTKNPAAREKCKKCGKPLQLLAESYEERLHPRGRTGKWVVTMHRTNEKPTAFREADLPQYDVKVNGEKVGTVYARMSTPRHVSEGGGSSRVWHHKGLDGRSSAGHASKNSARDELIAEHKKKSKVQEAFFGGGGSFHFDPRRHPHDRLGRFAHTLAQVHAAGHGAESRIAGSSVRVRNHLGRLRVEHPGGGVMVKSPHGAAALALFYHDEHHGTPQQKAARSTRLHELRKGEKAAAGADDLAAWDKLGHAQRHVRLTTGPERVGPKKARGKGVPGRLYAPAAASPVTGR